MNLPAKDQIEKWRTTAFFLSMIAMLTGLLFSRALLSAGLISFVAISLIHRNILQQIKTFLSSPFLLSMSVLFALPALSGIWSDDHSQWAQILRIKLPLLLLPLCFAAEDNFKVKDWKKLSFGFLLLMVVGIWTSSWQYVQNAETINAAYLKAYTMETPVGNDHVRFSLLVVIAILTMVFLLAEYRADLTKSLKVVLLTLVVIHILFLHILAVRTGLICFYLGAFILLLGLVFRRRKVSFLLAFVLIVPVSAYFVLPTFKNRIDYMRYDLSFVQRNIYLPGSSDGNRFMSIKAGWELLKEDPVIGVGFGDIKQETNKFYEANSLPMSENDKILPSSEWMIYAVGTGWLGVILFSFMMLVPFFVRELRKNIYWVLLNIFIAFSYLFDIGLEVQFGVFIHAFILLWWYKWLRLKE